jgi:hypothetical protein
MRAWLARRAAEGPPRRPLGWLLWLVIVAAVVQIVTAWTGLAPTRFGVTGDCVLIIVFALGWIDRAGPPNAGRHAQARVEAAALAEARRQGYDGPGPQGNGDPGDRP